MILDTLSTAWYETQLRLREAAAYMRKTPGLMARELFPVDASSNPYAKSISFMTYDVVGQARIIADNAMDVPTGDVSASETAYPVAMIATAWDASNWEIDAAKRLGVDIEARQVNAAFDRVNRVINSLAFAGDAARNIPGIANDADVTHAAATHGSWISNDSAAYALSDLSVAYAAHQDNCSGSHEVTDILLPIKEYNWAATKKVSDYSDLTVLQWLAQALPFISSPANIHKVPEMTNFHSTAECALLYTKSDECMQLKIPQEIAYSAPQAIGLGQRTFCYARCGGLHIHFPKSVYYIYGL